MQYFMAYNHHIYKPKICGLELFIRMQYFMAYNHHIYKPKICGLELFIRMQYFMPYNHFIYKPKPTRTSLELLLIPRNRGKSGREGE